MVKLQTLDLIVIATYLVATVGVGFWVSRLASKDLRSYFLGGNRLPWYLLGLSNASGMFDISGTMLMVGWLYLYGLKSAWIPWIWPVFNQVVMMIYLSVWLRRSNVLTGAEWIRFRFGDGRGAQAAHLVVVVFAILSVVSLLAYGFIGAGKFASQFFSFQLATDPNTNSKLYALIITGLTTLYVVKGGMFSVVLTEVLQFAIMTVACLAVAFIAMSQVSPSVVDAATPTGWQNLWFGRELGLDWSELLPAADTQIASSGWNLFGIVISLYFVRGLLASAAGPTPGYDMQRVLSTRTPKEAALMSGVVSLVLLVPRYMLITGLTILALGFFGNQFTESARVEDFEKILPLTMRDHLPAGVLGLLIAALLAAFMSTFAATVNSAPAYLVNDIYLRYIDPKARDKTLVRLSYLASIAVAVAGAIVGLYIQQIQGVVNWMVAALGSGYLASNVLKWHWWRFNGWGYFWGMISGIVAALTIAVLNTQAFGDTTTLWGIEKNLALFPVVLGITTLACVAGSLATAPDDMEVLKEFYRRVRPWGFWRPVLEALQADDPSIRPNRELGRDAVNVFVGIAWQTALTTTGIYLVLRDYWSLSLALLVVAITSVFLKRNWYDKLQDEPA